VSGWELFSNLEVTSALHLHELYESRVNGWQVAPAMSFVPPNQDSRSKKNVAVTHPTDHNIILNYILHIYIYFLALLGQYEEYLQNSNSQIESQPNNTQVYAEYIWSILYIYELARDR